MISQKALKKLRKLTEKDGLHLNDEELLTMGTNLINLVEAVYEPIKKEWLREIKDK